MTKKNEDDQIANAMGLEPAFDNEIGRDVVVPDDTEDADYEYARKNIYEIIEKGIKALDDLSIVCERSQSPRAYEVLTNHIKAMMDSQRQLVDLKKAKFEMIRAGAEINQQNNYNGTSINQAVFVGSTADFQKLLQQSKKGPIIENEENA